MAKVQAPGASFFLAFERGRGEMIDKATQCPWRKTQIHCSGSESEREDSQWRHYKNAERGIQAESKEAANVPNGTCLEARKSRNQPAENLDIRGLLFLLPVLAVATYRPRTSDKYFQLRTNLYHTKLYDTLKIVIVFKFKFLLFAWQIWRV